MQRFGANYSNVGGIHIYGKISAYRAGGFQLDIYSNYPSKILKAGFVYIVVANYYRTFPNFRIINCEVPINAVIPTTGNVAYSCTINPPLNATNGLFACTFYGIDIVVQNTQYCLGMVIQSCTAVSTSVM